MFEKGITDHFLFEGRQALVVRPSVPANGRWLWKAEYFGAFVNFEEAMVERGWHVCYLEHETRWAPDREVEISEAFLQQVIEQYDLCPRGVAVGMSCGGLMATRLAEAHPERIEALYLDAPVLNILSMEGLGEAAFNESFHRELVDTYGFSKCSLVAFRGSPIDNMEPLLRHHIPVILIYGNADDVVIYAENGRVLEEYYRQHGGTLQVIAKSMCGHHPHGLENPEPIIRFIEQHTGENSVGNEQAKN